MSDAGRFNEKQNFGATTIGRVISAMTLVWLLPVVMLMASRGASTLDWVILLAIGVVAAALPWSMSQRVRVENGRLRARFWFLPGANIDVTTIEGLQVVKFHPLGDFGGWGFKLTRKHGRVYCISGEEGVRFRTGSRRYVIGSADPAGLALALAEAGALAPESFEPVSVREKPRYDAV